MTGLTTGTGPLTRPGLRLGWGAAAGVVVVSWASWGRGVTMGGAGACVPREVLVEARVGHGRRRAESE